MALPLIELLLVLSMPLLLPLFEEPDLADFVSEDLAEVFVLDFPLMPDVLLSEDADLPLLDLADGELLEEESELLPELPWFDEPMPESPMPEVPDEEEDMPPDMLPDWLDD